MRFLWNYLVIFILILMSASIHAQIKNPGYTGTPAKTDSLALWNSYSVKLLPSLEYSLSNIQLNETIVPQKSIKRYYDPKNIIPDNPFLMDTRSSSYYVPQQITDKLAHIMNRPTSNEIVPVYAMAMLAAKVALNYVEIEQKITIEAKDYLLDEKYLDILTELWKESPQTAEQLFRKSEISEDRTFVKLKQELTELSQTKIVKIKAQEAAQPLYFISQDSKSVQNLLNDNLDQPELNASQKQKIQKLLTQLNTIQSEEKNK